MWICCCVVAVDVRRKSRRLTTSLPIHSTPVQNKIRANASGYKATENSPEKETTIVFGRGWFLFL